MLPRAVLHWPTQLSILLSHFPVTAIVTSDTSKSPQHDTGNYSGPGITKAPSTHSLVSSTPCLNALTEVSFRMLTDKGPKNHVDVRILHSGSKAQRGSAVPETWLVEFLRDFLISY